MTLISTAVAVVGFTFIYMLLKRFPGKNIVEIFELSLGRFFGFIASAIIVAYLLFSAAIVIREFTEVMKVYVLLTSPPSFIITLFLSVVVILCYQGLETIARLTKLTAYILLFGVIFVYILGWKYYAFHRMLPIFGHGLEATILHGVRRCSAYGEIIVIAVIAGSLQGTKYIKRTGYLSLIISGTVISVSLLVFILSFPYFVAEEITAPMYQLAALINYGIFFQRMDSIFLFIWITSTVISMTVLFYSSTAMYCNMFRIQDLRPMILPLSIVLFAAAMLPKDIVSIVYGGVQRSREYGWIVVFVIPMIALFIAIVRKRRVVSKGDA